MAFINGAINLSAGAKLGFKVGLEEKLGSLQATPGTLYLTSDTHRLFIGDADGNLAPVCQGVISVASISDLPAASAGIAGQFYYLTNNNVLCVFNGSDWVQINPDTHVTDFSTTLSQGDNNVTVEHTITTEGALGQEFDSSFRVQGDTDTGVSVTSNGTVMTIKGDKYALGTNAADTAANAAQIKISSTAGNTSAINIKSADVSKLTTSSDAKGNITLSANTGIESVAVNPTSTGFNVVVTGNDGTSESGILTPKVTIGKNSDQTTNFVNGTNTLSVYTINEVDNLFDTKLKGLNAMTFKGTAEEVPAGNISSGDTYKVTSTVNVPAANSNTGVAFTANVGDMIVAVGTEGSDGYLTTAKWVLIPSGDDENATYVGVATDNGMTLQESGGNIVATMKLAAGNDGITLSDAKSADGTSNTITIAHKENTVGTSNTNVTQSTDVDVAIIVPEVTYDAYGHITKYATTTYNMVDTHNSISGVANSATKSSNTVTLKSVITMDDGDSGTVQFGLTSNTLSTTTSGNTVTMDLEWGTF